MGRGRVDVVIATRDRAAQLARCLDALAVQTRTPTTVAVVDDGSRDDTPRVLEKAATGSTALRHARHVESKGPAAARNRALALTSSPLVAFTDDDCIPQTDWLEYLVTALESGPPNVAGIGGRVVATRRGLIADYMTRNRILEPPASRSYIVTANCIYRREAILAAGGFDEGVRTPGGEDPGLAMKVRDAGWELSYEPRAVVAHEFRESVRDFARTFYRYGRGCRHVMA